MHNNIMAAGSRDHPPMLATGRYAQWQSLVPATNNTPAVPERTAVETILTMSPENKAHYESEKEAIHLLLTGIGDEIYSTVDACKTAHEMWIAIERLQQGESLNIQDVKTNLFWEFGKFTSHDGESMESYYSRFYKMMNEMIRNNLTVATMQYQKEVNEIRAERIAKNANPLALVAAASPYPDPYYQAPKSHKPYAPTSKQSSSTRSNASTKFKGKEIAKPITPPSESASKEDSLYKPTNNNIRTSSNTRNKNVDNFPRYKNDNQTGQFGNQRTVTVVGARETVGSQVVQQTGIQCFNCKEFGHFAKECRKPKRVKDSTYHKEKMLLCKQAKKEPESTSNTYLVEKDDSNVIPDSSDMCDNDIQIDQNVEDERATLANLIANLKLDTSRTLGETNSIRDSCLIALQNKQTELEKYMTFNDRTVDYDKLERNCQRETDELVKQSLLKSHIEGLVKEKTKVITDLKLKEEKDIDKMISMEKQLKFLNEIVYKRNQSIQTIHMLAPKGPTFNGRPTFANPWYLKKDQSEKPCLYAIPYDQSDPANRLVPDREETLTLEKKNQSKLNKDLVRPYDYTKLNSLYEIFKPVSQEYHEQLAHANDNDSFTFVHELNQEMHADLNYVESLENEIDELESDKAEFSNMYDILLQECVSNDVMYSYLHSLSDLDAHNELQCLYLYKVKECECLAQKLSKQTESINKEVYTELL
ncbi:retrovirus-related pol polyprotein from transposon TNT 1-94 [Tanacetum coccineum]